jgi:uncharacterized membrane protein (UPF0127 family)
MGDVTIINLDTPEARAKGLQHMSYIAPETIWVFPSIAPGIVFHSRNVAEPFDIAFLDASGLVLEVHTVEPTRGTVQAPERTAMALETKEGEMSAMGIDLDRKLNMTALLGKKS